jgi:putative transcriptional regulator
VSLDGHKEDQMSKIGAPLALKHGDEILAASVAVCLCLLGQSMIDSLTGNLLVASTLVQDPVRSSSVCLLVHHDGDGAIGVMLNRPLTPNPDALLAMLGKEPASSDNNRLPKPESNQTHVLGTVHFGGPLSGPVVAIHSMSKFAEAETGPGIYVAAQKHHLEGLVSQPSGPLRIIVGHLGWKEGELQQELDDGLWHLVPATPEVVFSNDREMWSRLIHRSTARSVATWIGTPDNPSAWEVN